MSNKSVVRNAHNRLLNKAKKMLIQYEKTKKILGRYPSHYDDFIKWYNNLFASHNDDMDFVDECEKL